MRCLNRQRANIVLSSLLQHGEILSPTKVSQRERVFERDGVLRWSDDVIIGYCRIGVSLQTLLSRIGTCHRRTSSHDLHAVEFSELLEVFTSEAYILWPAAADDEALIVLKEGCTPIDQLKAWAHALLLAHKQSGIPGGRTDDNDTSLAKDRLAEVRRTLNMIRDMFSKNAGLLEDKGWDLNVAALVTRAGTRVVLEADQTR